LSYNDYLKQLAQAEGIENPTKEQLLRLDRKRKKKTSNDDWTNPNDPSARVTKMKDGRTKLAYKAEHAVDLSFGALLAVTVQPADRGDTKSYAETLDAAQVEAQKSHADGIEEAVLDKGYHSGAVLLDLASRKIRSYVPEPERGKRHWAGKAEEQRCVYANRRRVRASRSKRLQKLRGELCERSFAHYAGAPRLLDKQALLGRLDLFARSRAMLIGYYPLMTRLQGDLADVFAAIRETGCLTALDAAGDGGTMDPLARILPHTDFYVPNESEAAHQTGRSEPRAMIAAYRDAGAKGWLGIKLGAKGALLSPQPGEFIDVAVVKPPGDVVDTTGAGDCFYGALLAGVLRGLAPAEAGRLAAAAGACCVTGMGATTAVCGFDDTARLAGLRNK